MPLDNHRIMLVDDHPIFLDAIGAAMSRRFPDSEIRMMSNIAQARSALHSEALPSLAVVDVNLPDGDGVELIEHMHAHGVLTIAFSGQADRFTVDACLSRGAAAFVEKSCDTTLFYSAVDAVLAGQTSSLSTVKHHRVARDKLRIKLTRRQKDVLEGVTRALSNKAIADELQVSEGTVKNHVSNLLTIFDANSRNELALVVRDQRYDILD